MDQRYRSSLKNQDAYNPIEDQLFKKEYNTILENALQGLTEKQRQVFILHRVEGKSYKEISETLKISHSAINQHLQAANKQLKNILKPNLLFFTILYLFFKKNHFF